MIDRLFQKPAITSAVVLVLTLVFIPSALKVKPMNSIEANAIQSDPAYQLLNEIQDTFGTTEEIVSIGLDSQNDILLEENLLYIDKLTKLIDRVEYVGQVLSLTSIKTLDISEDEIRIDPLVESVQLNQDQINSIQSHPIYSKIFLSPDGKASVIFVVFQKLGKDPSYRKKILYEINQILETNHKNDIKLYAMGSPYMSQLVNEIIEHDNKTVLPITFLIMAFILWKIYRRTIFVVLPFFITIIAVLWTIGFMGMLDRNMTAFTSLVPLVLFTICLCDSVHILNSIWKESAVKPQSNQKKVIILGLKRVLMPCFLTSITTIIGFLSLMTSDMISVRELGGFSAFGTLFAFLFSVILVPIVLFYVRFEKNKDEIDGIFINFSLALRKLGGFVADHYKIVLLISLGVSTLSIAGLMKLKVGQETFKIYKNNTSLKEANQFFMEREVGSSGEADIIFKAAEGTFKNPDVLLAMEKIGKEITKLHYTQKVFSLVDMLSWMAHKKSEGEESLLLTQEEIDSGLAILEVSGGGAFVSRSAYMSDDAAKYRMQCFINFGNSIEGNQLEADMRAIVDKYLPDSINYEVTSRAFVWSHMVHYLANSQMKSFALAFICITLVIGILFKSFKVGLISIIPSAWPVLFSFGLLGWFGISLNSFTAMAGCIALGLAVDDTVHFLHCFKAKNEAGFTIRESIMESFENVGFPMFITTGLLSLGFSVFYFSDLTTTTEFGFLVSGACVVALIADLFILPPLLILSRTAFKPKKLKTTDS